MAPELLHGEFGAGGKSMRQSMQSMAIDVYSYGMCILVIQTCREPFYDERNEPHTMKRRSMFDLLADVARGDMTPKIPQSCPCDVQTLILDCWKRDPSQRPSFDDILSRLDKM
jgi:serine/threonine protein kinase